MTRWDRDRTNQRPVAASEVGEYMFCAHSWWLHRVRGERSANQRALAGGSAAHRGHGWASWRGRVLGWLGWICLASAVIMALALFLWSN